MFLVDLKGLHFISDFLSESFHCIIYIKEMSSLNIMLVIGPTLLSGIGQHAKKYTEMFPD